MGLADDPTRTGGAVDAAEERGVGVAARLGFAARGVLYGVLALLVVQLITGGGDDDASQQGALEAISEQPFGSALLGTVAVGLAGYALFRLVQAIRGDGEGDGRVRQHGVPAVRAATNAGVSVLAFAELLGSGSGGDGETESSITGTVLDLPGGVLLVAAVGVIVVGVGIKQLVDAARGDVNELSDPSSLPPRARRGARVAGRLGYVGRGLVLGLVGGFLVRAAIEHDPDEGVGLDAALREVVDAPFGPWLIAFVALCLLAFAVHCMVEAVYARRAPAT